MAAADPWHLIWGNGGRVSCWRLGPRLSGADLPDSLQQQFVRDFWLLTAFLVLQWFSFATRSFPLGIKIFPIFASIEGILKS